MGLPVFGALWLVTAAATDAKGSIAAGDHHTLVVDQFTGDLNAVGHNREGQLGLGDTGDRYQPSRVRGNVAFAAAGGWHSLVVDRRGDLFACGYNHHGQLGLGDTRDRHAPVKVRGDVAFAAAGAFHSLVVDRRSDLFAFGDNTFGQLGLGDTRNRHAPVKVRGDVAFAAAGRMHSLVVDRRGDLFAFGSNYYGQLGLGDTRDRHAPVKVRGDVAFAAAGQTHSLVVDRRGDLFAFGNNWYGRLGLGDTRDRHAPVKVRGDVAFAAAGGKHSLVVDRRGDLFAFGDNMYGQLGLGDTRDRHAPVKVRGGVAFAAAGKWHSLVVHLRGGVYAFGSNKEGQLGTSRFSHDQQPSPQRVRTPYWQPKGRWQEVQCQDGAAELKRTVSVAVSQTAGIEKGTTLNFEAAFDAGLEITAGFEAASPGTKILGGASVHGESTVSTNFHVGAGFTKDLVQTMERTAEHEDSVTTTCKAERNSRSICLWQWEVTIQSTEADAGEVRFASRDTSCTFRGALRPPQCPPGMRLANGSDGFACKAFSRLAADSGTPVTEPVPSPARAWLQMSGVALGFFALSMAAQRAWRRRRCPGAPATPAPPGRQTEALLIEAGEAE